MSLSLSVLKAAVMFASLHSGYHMPADLPTVRFVDACALGKVALDEPQAVDCGAAEKKASEHVYALYDYWGSGVIMMPLECERMDSLICNGAIRHEATHWLQGKAGAIKKAVAAGCPEKMEAEAYAVEAAYYKAHGSSLAAQGISPWLLIELTSCHSLW